MTTLERLQTILIAHYPVGADAVTRETWLEQLDIDSLGLMELFFAIEDEFGISVPNNNQREMKQIGDVVDYIDELLSQQNVSSAAGQRNIAAADSQRAGP